MVVLEEIRENNFARPKEKCLSKHVEEDMFQSQFSYVGFFVGGKSPGHMAGENASENLEERQ